MLIYQTRIIVKKSNVLKLRKISKMPPESFMLTFTKLLNMSGMIFFSFVKSAKIPDISFDLNILPHL